MFGLFAPRPGETRNAIVKCSRCAHQWESEEAMYYHYEEHQWKHQGGEACPNCKAKNTAEVVYF